MSWYYGICYLEWQKHIFPFTLPVNYATFFQGDIILVLFKILSLVG